MTKISHLYQLSRSHLKCSVTLTFKLLLFAISISLSYKTDALPIDTSFTLPSPLPTWPPGGGFATGEIDLGGLQIRQITSFQKVVTVNGGGPDNSGATFLEPSPIPDGFFMLGSYAQPNNRPLSGWILVGKSNSSDILKPPTDYTLIWGSNDGSAFFWLPIPPDGYKAAGLVVTASPDKPSPDKIRCVRSDFTADAEIEDWILNKDDRNVFGLRPKVRGSGAIGVKVGTFVVQNDTVSLSCLINKNLNTTGRLSLSQMQAVFQTYAPYIYLHPDEGYLPSSVYWFFSNGALLYKKGEESSPVRVEPNGTNLPLEGDSGTYWLDLPTDGGARDMVKKGNLESAEAYVHFKPIFGGTFTDIQVWMFYPFNGHATAKIGKILPRISLGRVGEHVGDWEHVTLRISNFDGVLYKVYFSQHSGGEWIDSSLLGFGNGNRFVGYSSKNGHAGSYKEGLILQGPGDGVGIRNDWGRSDKVMDTGARFVVVGAEGEAETVVGPRWVDYNGRWGPTENYDTSKEVGKVKKFLPGKLKKAWDNFVKLLDEIYGKVGPTGPKVKNNWNGDEE